MKTHIFNPDILRAADIRGIFDKDLNLEDAYYIGLAFASMAQPLNSSIAVGYDGRLSSPFLKDALHQGIIDAGVDVIDIGLVPTPMLYYATYKTPSKSGIMITGSHNPSEYNGFKFMLNQKAFFGSLIQELGKIAAQGRFTQGKGKIISLDVSNDYAKEIACELNDATNIKVVWDCGNGACGNILREILKNSLNENIIINQEIDGRFPNHHPDPTIPSNLTQLIDKVKATNADIGIAFDGDGDRIGVINGLGEIIWADQFMIFLAQDVLQNHHNATIIADVKASNSFFAEVAKAGGTPLMWKTGHSFIKAKMLETKAPFAGEMSGHIFFADKYYGFDDALYAASRLINYIYKSGKSFNDLTKKLPRTYNTPEIRIDCPEHQKDKILQKIQKKLEKQKVTIDFTDGLRVSDEKGWWLLRRSNTQPIMVARCEADTLEGLEKIKNSLASYVNDTGLEFPNI